MYRIIGWQQDCQCHCHGDRPDPRHRWRHLLVPVRLPNFQTHANPELRSATVSRTAIRRSIGCASSRGYWYLQLTSAGDKLTTRDLRCRIGRTHGVGQWDHIHVPRMREPGVGSVHVHPQVHPSIVVPTTLLQSWGVGWLISQNRDAQAVLESGATS